MHSNFQLGLMLLMTIPECLMNFFTSHYYFFTSCHLSSCHILSKSFERQRDRETERDRERKRQNTKKK